MIYNGNMEDIMIVKSANGMFRCDDACCKNFSSVEIITGGALGRLSLCDEHFIKMLKDSKQILKSEGFAKDKSNLNKM